VENADIKLSELSIGIGPFVIGPVVQRRIGLSAFSHLAIDASMWRNAEWAKRKGLYAEVHNDVNGMDESISRLATSLTQANPSAVSELKRCFWEGSENWDLILTQRAAISGRLALSEFAKQELQKLKHRS